MVIRTKLLTFAVHSTHYTSNKSLFQLKMYALITTIKSQWNLINRKFMDGRIAMFMYCIWIGRIWWWWWRGNNIWIHFNKLIHYLGTIQYWITNLVVEVSCGETCNVEENCFSKCKRGSIENFGLSWDIEWHVTLWVLWHRFQSSEFMYTFTEF